MKSQVDPFRIYITGEDKCSYLPDRSARHLLVWPDDHFEPQYSELIRLGFRRSGSDIYRPCCIGCQECVSMRIPVDEFRPNRALRRTTSRNEDLTVTLIDRKKLTTEQGELFEKYVNARHKHGGMDTMTPHAAEGFFFSRWSDSRLLEMRLAEKLLAVAVTDILEDSLSAVYTFFDPNEEKRSLGTEAVLRQIELGRNLGKKWVYLGYWVKGSDKMDYKKRFLPHDILLPTGEWRRIE